MSDPGGIAYREGVQVPWVRDVLLGLGVTAAITLLFRLTDLDLRWQALAYSPVEPHWPYGGLLGWDLLYHLGTVPGLVLGVVAAVGLGLSFTRAELVRWRYPCLFLVLLLALGPGLIINLLAKGFGGRPRPDQILQFGGLLAFRFPFQLGFPHRGFSFLCGHCSMGFMFMGLFFLMRDWRRWAWLAGGFTLGVAQGVGRMVQGAHFASDALLGASVMFTLAAALSPVAAWQARVGAQRRYRFRVAGATALLIVVMVGSFLLSMPVREEGVHVWLEPGQSRPSAGENVLRWRVRWNAPAPSEVVVAVEVGDIVLELGRWPEPMRIRSLVTGFAFPGAGSDITAGQLDTTAAVSFRQHLSGFFMEKHGAFHVALREDAAAKVHLTTGDGEIILAGPRPARPLVVSGKFRLSDRAGLLSSRGQGSYALPGEGEPVVLTLEAAQVTVQF